MADIAAAVELYGTSTCPYTSQLREHLLWHRIAFVEYDVDADAAARARLVALSAGPPVVPVLVEHGSVKEVGWRGRGCRIGPPE